MSDGEVKLFCFLIEIDGSVYGGHIPARDWAEAQEKVGKFGAKIDGELVEEQNASLCAVCRGVATTDLSEPQPTKPQSDFDFPEDSPVFE